MGPTTLKPRSSFSYLVLPLLTFAGCTAGPVNPSFSISTDDASADLRRIAAERKKLPRPLLIISGLVDPGFAAWALRERFDSLFDHPRIITVSIGEQLSLEGCRRKVWRTLRQRFGDQAESTQLDVIGFSLGGVVARMAADPPDAKAAKLRIARLFTISSPNQGSSRARDFPLLHPMQRDLRPGSSLLVRLNAAPRRYEIYPYVRLGDTTIGDEFAAPAGMSAWWVATPAWGDAHNGAYDDPRIIADIARRLCGESALATMPPAPLPASRR